MTSPQQHYDAALRLMRSHDQMAQGVGGPILTTSQSTESAAWVIAQALMGLLKLQLQNDTGRPPLFE